jgi:hypothetical protein
LYRPPIPNFRFIGLLRLLSGAAHRVISAKVLEFAARIRRDCKAHELREGVIGVRYEIRRHSGDAAFHPAARDLVASVTALLADVEGRRGSTLVFALAEMAYGSMTALAMTPWISACSSHHRSCETS